MTLDESSNQTNKFLSFQNEKLEQRNSTLCPEISRDFLVIWFTMSILISSKGSVTTVKPWLKADRRVDALNLHACVETCVGWPNGLAIKFPRKYTQVEKKKHYKADYPLFHGLIID